MSSPQPRCRSRGFCHSGSPAKAVLSAPCTWCLLSLGTSAAHRTCLPPGEQSVPGVCGGRAAGPPASLPSPPRRDSDNFSAAEPGSPEPGAVGAGETERASARLPACGAVCRACRRRGSRGGSRRRRLPGPAGAVPAGGRAGSRPLVFLGLDVLLASPPPFPAQPALPQPRSPEKWRRSPLPSPRRGGAAAMGREVWRRGGPAPRH